MALTESRAALNQALLQSGRNWDSIKGLVNQWWADLKQWEANDTFDAAFQDRRMTVRQVNVGTTARGGGFDVPNVGGIGGNRHIELARNVAGIRARANPLNFFNREALKREKNNLGLHDLSASLLNPRRLISTQLKSYEDCVAMFMPAPLEEDLQLFHVLNDLGKNELKGQDDHQIRTMRSQFTRIKLAQASDMGTTFVDISGPGSNAGKIRYGTNGTIIRTEGGSGEAATQQELAARKSNALRYKSIIDQMVTTVNEVILAYRQHASPLFPMFAVQADVTPMPRPVVHTGNGPPPPPPPMPKKGETFKVYQFAVVTPETGTPTGWVISDNGRYTAG